MKTILLCTDKEFKGSTWWPCAGCRKLVWKLPGAVNITTTTILCGKCVLNRPGVRNIRPKENATCR